MAKKSRECGMMTNVGAQGVGKTYQNMHVIKDYVRDKFRNGVKGRKVLILDTNGEYVNEQFSRNDIKDFVVKTIAVKDIEDWSRTENSECRRIDMKSLSIPHKKSIVEYILKVYIKGMLVLEDINTYILSVTHIEEIVGGLVNLRHRGVDVMISFQRLRAVEPIILANSRWIRMHHQVDNVDDVKGKISDPALFKIAQLIVNNRYLDGDKRFFLIIHVFDSKLSGKFTINEFEIACKQYLNLNKKQVREFKDMHNVSIEDSVTGQIKLYKEKYYAK